MNWAPTPMTPTGGEPPCCSRSALAAEGAGRLIRGGLYPPLPMTDETRLKRLRFRAWRRGFREADLILGPFADSHARSLTARQLETLEILLEQPDPDLYAWI